MKNSKWCDPDRANVLALVFGHTQMKICLGAVGDCAKPDEKMDVVAPQEMIETETADAKNTISLPL